MTRGETTKVGVVCETTRGRNTTGAKRHRFENGSVYRYGPAALDYESRGTAPYL